MSECSSECSLCSKVLLIGEEMVIGKCMHISCGKCLVSHITKNLNVKVKCPVRQCPQFVKDPIIRKCLSGNQTSLYEELSVRQMSTRKCPLKECSCIYICEDNQGIFICGYCGAPICMKCDKMHYPGECITMKEDQAILNRAMGVIKEKRRKEFMDMDSKYDLMPNPDPYECVFCTDFILPMKGVILRNCLHCFCENCLKETYNQKNFSNQIRCQKCNVQLDPKELRVLIEEKRYISMMVKEATLLMFHCKGPGCTRVIDPATNIESYNCPDCKSVNCLKCQDIHQGLTCQQFIKTTRYKDIKNQIEKIKKEKHVDCFHCGCLLIKKEGCGSLNCTNCGFNTCVFTGLFAGTHKPVECGCLMAKKCPKEKKYCECTSKTPCHTDCEYGCIPE